MKFAGALLYVAFSEAAALKWMKIDPYNHRQEDGPPRYLDFSDLQIVHKFAG